MSVAVEGLGVLVHYRKEILTYVKKVRHWLRHGKERIVVLGAGGVGKTTLGHVLSGKALNPGKNYQESIDIENFDYEGRIFGSIIVAPGQTRRRQFHWPIVRTEIAKGKILGVIYVVAGGYNSLREIEPSEHEVYAPSMSVPEFMEKYREFNCQNELRVLRDELSQSLKDSPRRVWFVTAVIKQDLWAHDQKQVMKLYKEGPYDEVIKNIHKARGDKEFIHECLPVSLLIENLRTQRGVILAETASGFDAARQLESVREFSRAISELIVDREVRGS
jgi:GTPase SAR1 family protein